jgi:hypothetical protein
MTPAEYAEAGNNAGHNGHAAVRIVYSSDDSGSIEIDEARKEVRWSVVGRCCRKSRIFWPQRSRGDLVDDGRAHALALNDLPSTAGSRNAWEVRWPENSEGQGLQILYDGGEMEFVARTRKPSKSHAFESVMGLEMGETHLDALAFVA